MKMSFDNMLYEFMEGELNETNQEVLFNELSKNSELRQKFNSFIKMDNVTSKGFTHFTPPLDLTNKVFSNAGFKSPLVSRFLLFSIPNIISLILALGLIGTITYFTYLKPESNNDIIEKSNIINSSFLNLKNGGSNENYFANILTNENLALNQSISNQSIENFSKFDNNFNSNQVNQSLGNNFTSKLSNNSEVNNADFGSNENDNLTTFNITNKSEAISINDQRSLFNSLKSFFNSLVLLENSEYLEANSLNQNYTNRNINIIPTNNSNIALGFNIGEDKTKFAFAWRNLMFNDNSNINTSNSQFANNAIGVFYKYNSNFAFFTEFGLEKFVQNFSQNISGISVETIQNPELFWAVIGSRYTIDGIFDQHFINPYIQLSGGASSIGAVVRPNIGFTIRPSEVIFINANYEHPILFYSAFGKNYSSSKGGISFGFSFNF